MIDDWLIDAIILVKFHVMLLFKFNFQMLPQQFIC